MEFSREAVLYVQDFFAQYTETVLDDWDQAEQFTDLQEDLQDYLQEALRKEEVLVSPEQQLLVDRYYDLTPEEVDVLFQWVCWAEKYQHHLDARIKDMIMQSIDRDFTLPNPWS